MWNSQTEQQVCMSRNEPVNINKVSTDFSHKENYTSLWTETLPSSSIDMEAESDISQSAVMVFFISWSVNGDI